MYKAFISYTLEDKECAERLERDLLMLAHSEGLDTFKIFRDSTYSKVGENVQEGLKKNLEESEWLIVICSPYVKKPDGVFNWVNFECDYFYNVLGRKKNVVCFISDSAPSSRDITGFYPDVIRGLSAFLAADGRGAVDWFRNVEQTYRRIMERGEAEGHEQAVILWESRYAEVMNQSHELYQIGKTEQACSMIRDISYSYGVKGLEWYLLYALETKAAYGGFLGRPKGVPARQIICFDGDNQYLCISDGSRILLVDYRTMQLLGGWMPHEGKAFEVIQSREPGIFATVGAGAVLKYWRYLDGKLQCLLSVPLTIKFKDPRKSVFHKLEKNGSKGTNAACLNFSADTCAVVTGDVVTVVCLGNGNQRVLDLRLPGGNKERLPWYWISFSEDNRFLFISNGEENVGWELAENTAGVYWGKSDEIQINSERLSAEMYTAYLEARKQKDEPGCLELKGGELWNHRFVSEYAVKDKVMCAGDDRFILSGEDGKWLLLDLSQDLEERKGGGDVCAGSLECLSDILELEGLADVEIGSGCIAVSGKWIACTDNNGRNVYLFTRQGQYQKKHIICDWERAQRLSAEELRLPENHSSLFFDYVNRKKNPELFEAVRIGFLEEDCIAVFCDKHKSFLWRLDTDEWMEIEQDNPAFSEKRIERTIFRNDFVTSYVTRDNRRKVVCQGSTLSFSRIKDNKTMLSMRFPHAAEAFYFSRDERMLMVKGDKKVFRYEIPCFPDHCDGFLEELLRKRREKAAEVWKSI